MKSNYYATGAKIKNAVDKEIESRSDAIFKSVAEQLLPQVTAMELYVLRTEFNFGKKRLMRFLNEKNDLNDLLSKNEEIAGRKLSTKDIMNAMEDYLGIELKVEEMSIQDTPKSKKRRIK